MAARTRLNGLLAYLLRLCHHRAPVISDAFLKERHAHYSMPASTNPSTAEEEAFMAQLLANPPVTPTRHRKLPPHNLNPVHSAQRTTTPTRQLYSVAQVDIEEEVSGWSWDALSDYVPTPKKSRNSPTKPIRHESGYHVSTPPVVPKYAPEPCTRCSVRSVTDTWNDDVREKVRTPLTVHLCL